jgi:hypothetical protein
MTTTRTMGWGHRAVAFRRVFPTRWEADRGALSVSITHFSPDEEKPWDLETYALSYGTPGPTGLRLVSRLRVYESHHGTLEEAMAEAWEYLVENAPMNQSKEG